MVVSVALLKAASELECWGQPSFVAGHSLGEYTALVAADVLPFADAICLVRERGRLMQKAGDIKHGGKRGGMAAVMGLIGKLLRRICHKAGVQIANINSPGQVVISGEEKALSQAMEMAKAEGARVVPLEVSGAFHSHLMEPAAEELARAIANFELHDPKMPIVSNTTAQPLTTAEEVREELQCQLCHCIQWQGSVEYMVDSGVSTFIELGPSKVLSGLIKRTNREVLVLNISDPASINTFTF
jgi:[acyl-carrier-protein] S-malonyltransferase